MRLRSHMICWLAIAGLAGCDRAEKPKARADASHAAPQVTRARRPPRGSVQDARSKLRERLAAANALQSPEQRDKALAGLAWDALEQDPELARDALQQLAPDSSGRIGLLQHIVMRLAEKDPQEALAWAGALGSEKEIAAAKDQIALVISNTDPEAAANLLSEAGIAGREFDVAAVQVLTRWAAKSPPAAAAWVAMFPPGDSREAGVKTVISQWAETDAAAAMAWMSTVTDTAVRQETALAMAEALLVQPPDVRTAWLEHADPALRDEISAQQTRAEQEVGDRVIVPRPSE